MNEITFIGGTNDGEVCGIDLDEVKRMGGRLNMVKKLGSGYPTEIETYRIAEMRSENTIFYLLVAEGMDSKEMLARLIQYYRPYLKR